MVEICKKTVLLLCALLLAADVFAGSADTVRIVFIGDVMAHGSQLRTALKPGADSNDPDGYDFSASFQYVKNRFDAADFVVANMEFPCGVRPYAGFPLFSTPQAMPEDARRAGIDLFLTANNHICDKGRAGMDSTYAIYTRMGVPFTGMYRGQGEEYYQNPLIIDIKGFRVAFINFTYGTNGLPVPPPWRVNLLDSTHVREVIGRAQARGAELRKRAVPG